MSEDPHYSRRGLITPHVVGLGEKDYFMLDTELGVIYWPECPDEIKNSPSREPILDSACDYAPEDEEDWRAEGAAWAIIDFFELLKDQFRELCFVPLSWWSICDIYSKMYSNDKDVVPRVQAIYREHGWPDLERYRGRKEECLRVVRALLDKHYPLYACPRVHGDTDE